LVQRSIYCTRVQMEKGIFFGGRNGATQCNIWGKRGICRAKTAELIELPFGMVNADGPRNCV